MFRRYVYICQYLLLFPCLLIQGQSNDSVTNIPLGFYPVTVKVVDMNMDGNMDLVIMPRASDTFFAVYFGLGDETFGTIPDINEKEENFQPFGIADINLDKIPDLVISSYWNNGFKVYFGDKKQNFTPGPLYNMGAHATDLTLFDIDKDGFKDVVGITSGSATPITLQILKGDKDGNFHFFGKYPTLLSANNAMFIEDKDGDGLPDVMVTTIGWVILFYQKSDGSFQVKYWPTYHSPTTAIGDINGDKVPDMVMGYPSFGDNSTDSIVIRFGEADTMFSLKSLKIMVPGLNPSRMFIHDLDNDSYPELLVSHANDDAEGTDSLFIFAGLGNNGFVLKKIVQLPGTFRNLAVADLANDGYPEVIVLTSQGVTILHNHGTILSAKPTVKPASIRLYPNPTLNWINVELPEGKRSVRFTNMDGRVLYNSEHSGNFKIDISSWTDGIYIFQAYQNNRLQYSQVLIKQ